MRALALLLSLALLAAAPAPVLKHATGTFEVKLLPEAQAPAPAEGVPTARMAMEKDFDGGLVGAATGTMLSAGALAPGSAAYYVAIDQFRGKLAGRFGGFVLLHRGTMSRAGSDLAIAIAPDSGTGELKGITGALKIEIKGGKHFYDLAYSLPPKR